MKSHLFLSAAVFFAACHSTPSGQTEMAKSLDSSATPQTINSPYPIRYSSKFAIDSPKNAETLLTMVKDYDNGDLSAHKTLLADTVEFNLFDGSKIRASRDTAIAMIQRLRNTFAASVDHVIAVTAIKSTDSNDHWVLLWTTEIDTDKKGNVDSAHLMETWRFNKDGKADLLIQFRQAAYPPQK